MKKIIAVLIMFSAFTVSVNATTLEDNLETLISKNKTIEKDIFLNNYPIGSVYETTASDENTVEKMAQKHGGEWQVYGSNKLLRGTTGAAGETGGSDTTTLTTSNLPEHSHSFTPAGTISSTFTGSQVTSGANSVGHTHTVSGTSGNPSRGHTHSISGTSAGNNRGHTHGIPALSVSTNSQSKDLTGSITMHNAAVYTEVHIVSGVFSAGSTNSNAYYTPTTVGGVSGAPSIGRVGLDASHTHSYTLNASTSGGISANHTHSFSGTTGGESQNHTHTFSGTSGDENQNHTHNVTAAGTVSSTFTGTASTTESKGSGTAMSVYDPYITVYRYKRIG